jgi:hypothetical protein
MAKKQAKIEQENVQKGSKDTRRYFAVRESSQWVAKQ